MAAFLQRDYLGGTGLVSLFSDPSAAESALDSGSDGQLWATLVAAAATVFVLPFVAGAVSRIVSAAYLGERMTAGEALRAVRSRWWAFTSPGCSSTCWRASDSSCASFPGCW